MVPEDQVQKEPGLALEHEIIERQVELNLSTLSTVTMAAMTLAVATEATTRFTSRANQQESVLCLGFKIRHLNSSKRRPPPSRVHCNILDCSIAC